jgi:hypothetical protein
MGMADDMIRAAMEVGHMVEKGSMVAMRNFAKGVLETPARETPACHANKAIASEENCCAKI